MPSNPASVERTTSQGFSCPFAVGHRGTAPRSGDRRIRRTGFLEVREDRAKPSSRLSRSASLCFLSPGFRPETAHLPSDHSRTPPNPTGYRVGGASDTSGVPDTETRVSLSNSRSTSTEPNKRAPPRTGALSTAIPARPAMLRPFFSDTRLRWRSVKLPTSTRECARRARGVSATRSSATRRPKVDLVSPRPRRTRTCRPRAGHPTPRPGGRRPRPGFSPGVGGRRPGAPRLVQNRAVRSTTPPNS